jgi:hypothetical protein
MGKEGHCKALRQEVVLVVGDAHRFYRFGAWMQILVGIANYHHRPHSISESI